jgi:hypothetical protein
MIDSFGSASNSANMGEGKAMKIEMEEDDESSQQATHIEISVVVVVVVVVVSLWQCWRRLTLSGDPSRSALTVTHRPLIPFIAFSPGIGLLGGQGAALYCGLFRLILTGPTASAGPPVPGASCAAVRAPSDSATDCPRKERRPVGSAASATPSQLPLPLALELA